MHTHINKYAHTMQQTLSARLGPESLERKRCWKAHSDTVKTIVLIQVCPHSV